MLRQEITNVFRKEVLNIYQELLLLAWHYLIRALADDGMLSRLTKNNGPSGVGETDSGRLAVLADCSDDESHYHGSSGFICSKAGARQRLIIFQRLGGKGFEVCEVQLVVQNDVQ
jgi:hypothetical protein